MFTLPVILILQGCLDTVVRNLLPEMTRLLDLDQIKVYLLSEDVITKHDLPKIKVTDQNSKNSAIVNLYEIVVTREMLHSFVSAIRRSSEDHPGHKQLLEKIEERKRRMSTVVESKTCYQQCEDRSIPPLISFHQSSDSFKGDENTLLLLPLCMDDDSIEVDKPVSTGSPQPEEHEERDSEIHEALSCEGDPPPNANATDGHVSV